MRVHETIRSKPRDMGYIGWKNRMGERVQRANVNLKGNNGKRRKGWILVACVNVFMWEAEGKGNNLSTRGCVSNHRWTFILQKRLCEGNPRRPPRPTVPSPMSNHEHLCAVSRSSILPLRTPKARANARFPSTGVKRTDTWGSDGTPCRRGFSVDVTAAIEGANLETKWTVGWELDVNPLSSLVLGYFA